MGKFDSSRTQSQEHAICFCLEPDQSSANSPDIFKIYFNITLPLTHSSSKVFSVVCFFESANSTEDSSCSLFHTHMQGSPNEHMHIAMDGKGGLQNCFQQQYSFCHQQKVSNVP